MSDLTYGQTYLTYKQMCEVIAEDWNDAQDSTKVMNLTWEDIWDMPTICHFPAIHVPFLYNAAKDNNLIGLLLVENTYAKMFITCLDKKEGK